MKNFWRKHWFFAGVGVNILLALLLPDETFIGNKKVILDFLRAASRYLIAFTFVASGVRLETSSLLSEIKNAKGILLGMTAVFIVAPAVALGLSKAFSLPEELFLGMALMASMPTTVASGIILTTLAGGSIALALCLTVISNLICPLTIPFVLKFMGAQADTINIPVGKMMFNLFVVIVIPFAFGQILRPFIRHIVEKIKAPLSKISQVIILILIFSALWGSIDDMINLGPMVLALIGLALVLHLIMLAFNFYCGTAMKLSPGSRKAVTLVASQKTVAVAYQVWNDAFGGAYIILVPSILHHLTQLVVDSAIAHRWHDRAANQSPAGLEVVRKN